jgi:DMSO/TMAO reductase YedYZ molybdopterin-dependent catalytic subunit
VDIHCVTKWSKLDTRWEGVSIDTLLEHLDLDPDAMYVTAFCDGGYTTNLSLVEIINGQAFVAYQYDDKLLPAEHGGPARLVVPHLYFWKSAKWIRGLRFMEKDLPGFWEVRGYNNHGDPWKEERY